MKTPSAQTVETTQHAANLATIVLAMEGSIRRIEDWHYAAQVERAIMRATIDLAEYINTLAKDADN